MQVLLIVIYPLVLVAWVGQRLVGSDPLRLREPTGESLWMPRQSQPTREDYFSMRSCAEGAGHGGWGWIAAVPLRWLSRWYAPKRSDDVREYTPSVDRQEGIPDEVYTLW